MNLERSEEQTMLADMLGRFLREHYGFEDRARILADGHMHDTAIWHAFADELGILGAAFPEALGGLGGGPVETMIIMEELGRALSPEPYLETVVMAGGLLAGAGGEPAARALQDIIAGQSVCAVATGEATGPTGQHVATTATETADGWCLNGVKPVVVAAPVADRIIVAARTLPDGTADQGLSLFLIAADASGLTRRDYALIDGRAAADLTLSNVIVGQDALIGPRDGAGPLVRDMQLQATVALCSEAVGVMRRMLDDTAAFLKERHQFGQPLSSFQVLQHRVVDMHIQLELAVSATLLATLRLGTAGAEQAVVTASATVGDALRFVAQNAVQLHGAMGMTEELPVGHYFKRATSLGQQLGPTYAATRRYAALQRAG